MSAAEAIIDLELLNNETRAQRFLKEVDTIIKHPGSYIPCPDCNGEGGKSWVCGFCFGKGCHHCSLGMILLSCETCQGRGEVYKIDDEIQGVFE
jgi:hypothetical protein